MFEHGLTSCQIESVRRSLKPYAAQIDRVAVFGSRATGRARPNSDIDLALYGAIDDRLLDQIWTRLDDCGLAVKVDVVAYGLIAHPLLKKHIDANARVLFTGDDLARP